MTKAQCRSMMNDCLCSASQVGVLSPSLTMEAKDNGRLSPHTTKQYVKIHNMSQGDGVPRRRQLTIAHLYLSPAALSRCPQGDHAVMSQDQGSLEEKVTGMSGKSKQNSLK